MVYGRRLVWHIGHHKTGSTSIQNTLAAGGVDVHGKTVLYTSAHHNYLAGQFRDWAAGRDALAGTKARPNLETTAELLARSDFDLAIFSGEDFEAAKARKFRRVLEEFFLPHVSELQVIVYLRPHAARTRSSFAERMKIGDYDGTLTMFQADFRNHIMYADRLAGWQEEFGDALTVRPMVRERLRGGSVVEDFMSTALGPDVPFTVTSDRSVNESLSLEQLLLIQEFRRQIGPHGTPMRRHTGRALGRLMAGQSTLGGNTPIALHRELAETIRDDYLADARQIDATYFADHPVMEAELHREVESAVPEAQSMDAADHLSDDVRETIRILSCMFQAVSAKTEVPAHRLFREVAGAPATSQAQG